MMASHTDTAKGAYSMQNTQNSLRRVLENLDRAQTAIEAYVDGIYEKTDYEDTPETSHAESASDLLDVARDVATCKKDLWVYLKVRDKYVTRTEDKCAYWEDGKKALDFGTISYAKGVQVGLLLNGYDCHMEIDVLGLDPRNPDKVEN